MKIKIITDSLSDIPRELAHEYDISIIPLTVRFGTKEFKDGIDIKPQEFYEMLKESHEIPSTSQVSPNEFKKAIKEALNSGYERIIIINGSSKVSGTYQSALLAKKDIGTNNIYVFDSRCLSYGLGMIVLEAAKMAKQKKSFEEIIEKIKEMIKGAQQIFSVDTLEYLHRNGRLSTAKMVLGTLLNVKPILAIIDGVVEPIDKVRGTKKLYKSLIDICIKRGLKTGSKIGLGHSANIEGVKRLKEMIEKELRPSEIVVIDIGCTIGSHTGLGTLAIFFIAE
ncbi:DegV family protein [Caminicella sporogenes]|uniref:DegV family protein n=1 Tax=Caminicella sporogenes TaxID=166485 RepID=UPI0025425169|nr:DegV family protein [Caminicella sporogenes]WIF94941.1 DegV family protein [Caminicella sporogenes]